MKKIMILDNYDSFTYNLVHAIQKITGNKIDVHRNDEIELEHIGVYDKIVLSPGPGIPDEAGILKTLIKEYAPGKSILGVCLGHQAIAEVFGGKLININKVYHGVATTVTRLTDDYLFAGIPGSFEAGRYHSWMVANDGLPDCFEITVVDSEGEVMGLRHKQFDVRGVQFHPESVLTKHGEQIIANWLNN